MTPLLPYFLVYLSGILTALPASQNFLFPYFLPAATGLAGVWVFVRVRSPRWFQGVILVLMFPLGGSAPGWQNRFRPENHVLNHLQEGKRATVKGWIAEPPTVYPEKTQYRIHLESITYRNQPSTLITGTARITLYQPGNSFRIGDRLRIHRVKLKRPRNFKNPGRFDYESYMRSQGIDVLGGVSKVKYIQVTGSEPPGLLTELRTHVRSTMLSFFDRHLDNEAAALLKAMVLGEKQHLSEELRQSYIDTGLAHLMAVSGLHIGFVAGACYLILYPVVFYVLGKYRPQWALLGFGRKIVALLCLLPVLFYMFLVGTKISALRAGIMVVVYLLAVLINREKNLVNALLVAAFLILIWNPEAVVGPGFLLSFGALITIVLAIEYVGRPSDDPLDQMGEAPWYRRGRGIRAGEPSWRERVVDLFYGTLFISLAALLGTLPILIYFFNHFSLGGIFLNLLLVPLTSLLIPLGLLTAFLAMLWEPLGSLLIPLPGMLLEIFVEVPQWAAALPYMSLNVPTPPALCAVLYYFLLFGIPLWFRFRDSFPSLDPGKTPAWKYGAPFCFPVAAGLMIALFLWPRWFHFKNGELSIFLLDVGQGESIYMEFPNGKTLLLDGGGYYRNSLDVGRRVVAPFLWNRGLWHLDYVGVTHSDHDHMSGVESLADLMPVNHFLDRIPEVPDRRIQKLKEQLVRRDTVPLVLEPGRPLKIGGVRLIALHPTREFVDQGSPAPPEKIGNDLSWVLRVDYGSFSMLLTGDITEKAERFLVTQKAALRADILKVPHHGSRTSSLPEFIRAVRPREVLVSSGKHNIFHHPHPQIVQRYQEFGIPFWRTDRDGAIRIISNGSGYKIVCHKDL
ncbi:MAG: DUF4131 domain-containing protein [Nitrospinaceae bacterium]|nr:DUF4131 domain-containing protein [Nitrospinaceae bacterium]NIR56501.1 DUF4131 domain-containing protein [Nitrospinaceae bacterium]NIS86959.1 DUF4131 domain-containing protein [Nitrospinaceae bacterium]NIT83803.1 DUF4131 domain-containing protein [Nitrospinaceae bacterium]NIU46009.1 DUF4131 domain-containing protein [Nitrospinaceae bacterium]